MVKYTNNTQLKSPNGNPNKHVFHMSTPSFTKSPYKRLLTFKAYSQYFPNKWGT